VIAVKRLQFPAFLVFWSTVVAVAFLVTRSAGFAEHPDVLSLAVTLDMVIVVPVVYLVLAHLLGWRLLPVIPILVVTLIAANLLIPSQHQRWLDAVELLLAPLELVLIVFLVIKVRAVRNDYRSSRTSAGDFYETLEQVLTRTLEPGWPAKIFATEISVFFYGLLAWRRENSFSQSRHVFSYHKNCGHGMVMGVFLFLVVLETSVLHWILLPRIAPLAWVLFALGLYSVVFLLADLNAARLRPIFIDGDELVVRTALRWRVRFPIDQIEKVETTTHDIEDKQGLLSAVLMGNQNVILHLKSPASADGLYGWSKKFSRISLTVDDLPAFVEAVTPHD
jgi:hypothetical protein